MRNAPAATLAAVILAASVSITSPVHADEPTPTCDSTGSGYCQPPTACEEEAVVATATIARLERRNQRAERQIAHKNATIKRLRAQLAQR